MSGGAGRSLAFARIITQVYARPLAPVYSAVDAI